MSLHSFFTKNQKLFFSHVFLRGIFTAMQQIGWVYLYLEGVPIFSILVSVFCFRLLATTVCIPLTYKLVQRVPFHLLFFLSLLLQGIAFGSFYFAPQGALFLAATVIIFALYDSLYYTLEADLERRTPHPHNIAHNVGVVEAIRILANASGILFITLGIQVSPHITFFLIFLGSIFSFLPVAFIKLPVHKNSSHPPSFLRLIALNGSLVRWLISPFALVIMITAGVSEFIESVPIFLAYFEINLIQIGWILAGTQLFSLIASITIGLFENNNRRILLTIFCFATALLFVVFALLPKSFFPWFLLLYSVLGRAWYLAIRTLRQRFVHKYVPPKFGGVFDLWIETSGRANMYGLILLLYIGSQDVSLALKIILFFGSMLIAYTYPLASHVRKQI